MKRMFIMLLCAGSLFLAAADHPFNTNGAVLLKNREAAVEISGGSDFIKDRTGNVKISVDYGIGDRFQIGMDNFWFDTKDSNSFSAPELKMKLSIRPDFIAIKVNSLLNAKEFGGFLLYTIKLKKSATTLNFDLGFESDGSEDGSFAWKYSIYQPINELFFGAEVYGNVADWMEKDDKKPLWQVGFGHKIFRKKLHTVSVGFGGSFVTKDDLYATIGVTKYFTADE